MRRTCILGTIMLVVVLIQGCAPGYNSVLFATRANLGFDADTAPPNLEVAISRQEGVLEPTFEGGQTVPVMASFSSDSSAFANFFWGVKSTFATGEAAFTMSYLYDDDTLRKPTDIPYERVTLSKAPDPQHGITFLKEGEVRPVLCGTDTILGIKIKWSGQTAQYPSSANIGFKRKEAAWAPIGLAPNRNPNTVNSKPYEADVASVLATIDTDFTAPGTSARLTYLQYFATGSAANNLARRREVREAMLRRAYPDQKIKMAEEGKALREANWKYIGQISPKFKSADESQKDTILTKAKELELVDKSVTKENFLKNLGDLSDKPITTKLEELAKFASAI